MKTRILLLICCLCVFSLTGCSRLMGGSKEFLVNWVTKNKGSFEDAVSGLNDHSTGMVTSLSDLFRSSGLSSVQYVPDANEYRLYFRGAYGGDETTWHLVYSPRTLEEINSGVEALHDGDPWSLDRSSDTEQVWTGGLNGLGYVRIEMICPSWYYVEIHYPT